MGMALFRWKVSLFAKPGQEKLTICKLTTPPSLPPFRFLCAEIKFNSWKPRRKLRKLYSTAPSFLMRKINWWVWVKAYIMRRTMYSARPSQNWYYCDVWILEIVLACAGSELERREKPRTTEKKKKIRQNLAYLTLRVTLYLAVLVETRFQPSSIDFRKIWFRFTQHSCKNCFVLRNAFFLFANLLILPFL